MTTLKRNISLFYLTFYGIGTIVGAGIYSVIGKIAGASGFYTPVAFLFSAMIAAFIGLCYSELSSRYPQSAGEAVYVDNAFHKKWLTYFVGISIIITGIVSASVMTKSFAGYFQATIQYFMPNSQVGTILPILLFVGSISVIAFLGVKETIKVAFVITIIEVIGILCIIIVCFSDFTFKITNEPHIFIPTFDSWKVIFLGAFLAIYSFIGFEDIVNMAEETIEPEKTIPKAIIISLIVSTILYILVAFSIVSTLPIEQLSASKAPFADIFKQKTNLPVILITIVSMIAIFNGALVQMVMASRVIYGLFRDKKKPWLHFLSKIHPKRHTPSNAIFLLGGILIFLAWIFELGTLAKFTSLLILTVFSLISASLLVIKIKNSEKAIFTVPIYVPAISFILCVSLILFYFFL